MLRRGTAPLAVALVALAAAAPAPAAPVRADIDGDGVFEDLESRVRSVDPARELRVIVTLERAATATRAAGLERTVPGLAVTRRFGVVDAVAATVPAGRIRALARAPGVTHVEADARVRAANASAQQSFGVTDARLDLPALDGDADGDPSTYAPADLVAAVIDTGIDAGHHDLDGGKVLAFKDFTSPREDPYDDNGHGTHVAGTIAGDGGGGRADGRGVAPAAGLVGLKVLDADGSGWSSDVIAAIDWVWKDPDGSGPAVPNGVTYGIEAINLSLGGDVCSDGTDAESRAVNSAADAGYVVAVAAGNNGFEPLGEGSSCTVSSPAAAEKAITVGAMADLEKSGFYLASFSTRGPTIDGRIKPDVAAPGVGITSALAGTATGYSMASGTSMATPFVAGVALLMRDLNPALTAEDVKQRIMETAVDWGSPGADGDHGAGRLDAYAAIAASATPTPGELATPPTALPSYQHVASTLPGTGATRTYTITAEGGFPLTLGLTTAGAGADFDMHLWDASGTLVRSSESPYRQEEMHLGSAAAGPYTLEVVSWEGSGTFYLDVSGGVAVDEGVEPAANEPEPEPDPEPTTSEPEPTTSEPEPASEPESAPADDPAPADDEPSADEPSGEDAEPALAAPAVERAPRLRGRLRKGRRLRVARGAWSGDELRIKYRWFRCKARGARCKRIRGATSRRYRLRRADVGRRIRARVVVKNAAGRVATKTRKTKRVKRAARAGRRAAR